MKTVSATLLNAIFHNALKLGIEKNTLLEKAGIDESHFSNPDSHVPCIFSAKLLQAASELYHEPDLNVSIFLGQHFQPFHLNLFGYLILNSPTMREAYKRAIDYQVLVGDGLHISFVEGDGVARIRIMIIEPEMLPYKRCLMDWHLAMHVALHRQLLGVDSCPEMIYMEHKAPENLQAHQDFFRCKLTFDADKYEIVVAEKLLDRKLKFANPQLYLMFQKMADELLLVMTGERLFSRKVSQYLLELIPVKKTSIEDVATRMAIGVRTLQRKLNEENVSFHELLNDVRKELALHHLAGQQLSISEISYLLGFAEPSVFHRSFKKWTGQTPKDYQQTRVGSST